MNRPTLLIGGGYDKQSEYDEWIESFDGKVKKLVLIGQTKEKIAECAKKHGFEDVILCDTFEEAIDTCYANAVSGVRYCFPLHVQAGACSQTMRSADAFLRNTCAIWQNKKCQA